MLMTGKEFKDEVFEYIESVYSKFEDYQKITMEVLLEFDRICEKSGLDYYLAYGTMLGAVRDHGQIPWDYDIDTFVKIDDREKLLKMLNEELGKDYYYNYINIESTYPTSCLRICKKGYTMMALHVDVFFLIGTPNNKRKREKFINKCRKVIGLRTCKYLSKYIKNNPQSTVLKIYLRFQEVIIKLIPNKYLTFLEERIAHKYPLNDSDYWFALQTVYKKVYPRRVFDTKKRIIVKEAQLNVPCGYEEFLSINYGDWRRYLPIKNRFEEFYTMKNIVDERQAMYEKTKGSIK